MAGRQQGATRDTRRPYGLAMILAWKDEFNSNLLGVTVGHSQGQCPGQRAFATAGYRSMSWSAIASRSRPM
jgi:hypothetical protein